MAIRLGIDASQLVASCAVSTELGIVAELTIEKPIENISLLIHETLLRAHINLYSLDEIVACIGPGSQTGVRTAVVTGNALSLALGIPIIGVTSTDAGAVYLSKSAPYFVAVSAGRRRWYTNVYKWENNRLRRESEIKLIDDLTPNIHMMFRSESAKQKECKSCAGGILLVAENQRQLIVQSSSGEILPYEGGFINEQ